MQGREIQLLSVAVTRAEWGQKRSKGKGEARREEGR